MPPILDPKLKARRDAFTALRIPLTHKAILCLDGGGIRGIMTVQLLRKIEELAGIPCFQLFDMVAGTSTGGIIAGLIAAGKSAAQIEVLYDTFVTQVFTRRSWFSSQFLDPPHWTKMNYRDLLRLNFGDRTIGDYCSSTGIDLLITSHDVTEGEETYFSFLRGRTDPENTYKDVLLRCAMEATMSAPTYFYPLERFVDGGVTTFNDPSLAALIEAVEYGPDANPYERDKVTLFSLGTGCRTPSLPAARSSNPPGMDVYFWLKWLMNESGNDSADMQSYLLRSRKLMPCDYRRFQLSLDRVAIARIAAVSDVNLSAIHVTPANQLSQLTDAELSGIEMDNVGYFPVMKALGQAMASYICSPASGGNGFTQDLVDPITGSDQLVTRTGDIPSIRKQMSAAAWLDGIVG